MVNRNGPRAARKLHALVQEAGIEVESVTPRHARIAIDAFAIYGKSRRHKAGLNYGDCFVHALAKATGLPLLFKGNDFLHTDLSSAL
jgi:ribonuclease VapC